MSLFACVLKSKCILRARQHSLCLDVKFTEGKQKKKPKYKKITIGHSRKFKFDAFPFFFLLMNRINSLFLCISSSPFYVLMNEILISKKLIFSRYCFWYQIFFFIYILHKMQCMNRLQLHVINHI